MLKISEQGLVRFIIGSLLALLFAIVMTIISPGEAKAYHKIIDQEELTCLAKNIYFEARGENRTGQYAVGLVTLNRLKSKRFPNTICKVVKQARYWNNNPVRNKCHFSWYCDGKSDRPKDKRAWDTALDIAHFLLLFNVEDFTKGSTHYHATYVKPKWSREMKVATVIGSHIFYE